MMRTTREVLLTALTTATVLVAIWSWSAITDGLDRAMATIVLVAVITAVIGLLGRLALPASLPGRRTLTALIQLAAAWVVVSLRIADHPIPIRYVPRMRLENAFVAAGDAILHNASPVPVIGGVLPLVLCGAGLALVLADVLARTLRLTALSGLVLLALLAVPISVIGSDTGINGAARRGVEPWLFAVVTLGWLAQVVLSEGDRLSRWGRSIDDADADRHRPGRAQSRGWAATALVAGAATLLALLVPLALPATRTNFSGWGNGGGGNGKVTVTNPMIDVRQNLVQGDDVPLVRVRTDDPQPSYLRIAVLTRFGSTQWSAGDRSIPEDHDAQGPVPIAGVTATPGTAAYARSGTSTGTGTGVGTGTGTGTYQYQLSISPDFASRWLPTPAPINEIHAEGDWRYDTTTDDFIAASKGLTTAGLSYRATHVREDLTAAALAKLPAGVGMVPSTFTSIPGDLPPIVEQVADEVTRDQNTPFSRAVALQNWFRNSGLFSYATDVTLGSGGADLATFLSDGPTGRRGYCQQFAAAMAAMARTIGIPARVAVGFLSPDEQPDGSYVYSSHDMHAWPELYFSGAGWVRFEPTPSDAGTTVPSYAHQPGTAAPTTSGPDLSAEPTDEARPSAAPAAGPKQEEAATRTEVRADRHVGEWIGVGIALVALACLVASPGVVRRRRRAARLLDAGEGIAAEDAWAEVRDTAIDLGVPWLDGLSPRDTRSLVAGHLATPTAREALNRLVDAIERERYARSGIAVEASVVREVLAGLQQSDTPITARRAAWWPRSVLNGRAAASSSPLELDRVG